MKPKVGSARLAQLNNIMDLLYNNEIEYIFFQDVDGDDVFQAHVNTAVLRIYFNRSEKEYGITLVGKGKLLESYTTESFIALYDKVKEIIKGKYK